MQLMTTESDKKSGSAAETFGDRLIEAATDLGAPKTQPALSKWFADLHNIKISAGMISRYTAGDEAPRTKKCRIFAKALGVCVEWLYTARGPKHPMDPLTPLEEQLIREIRAIENGGRDTKTEQLISYLKVDQEISRSGNGGEANSGSGLSIEEDIQNFSNG